MVEVFKTNVKYQDHAKMLIDQIQKIFIDYKVNFDLEDCDKILRIEGERFDPQAVMEVLRENNLVCVRLE